MRSLPLATTLVLSISLALAGCTEPPAQYPGQPGVGQFSTQDYGPGAAPPVQLPPPGPPVMSDPISDVSLPWLRSAAGGVLNELVAALPPQFQARVQGIPFVTEPMAGEVNAFAACNREHMPLMAMTDGLLQVESYVAQLRAIDEVFGTQKLDAYLQYMAENQRPRQPIVAPPPGLITPMEHTDYRKVVRQHQLLEEQMAFVLGHELGHHYLGHTGCANGLSGQRKADFGDLLRRVQRIVPVANQPNEDNADIAGVNNLLTAGARRPGYRWTERGALLTLDFFARMDRRQQASSPEDKLFGPLLSSHPNPADRVPKVKTAAYEWRRSGGVGFQPLVTR